MHHVVRTIDQPESKDSSGKITVEQSKIDVIKCDAPGAPRTEFYIYAYVKRPGYRAILPPDWSHAIGGKDFGTKEEAIAAACTSAPRDAGIAVGDAGAPVGREKMTIVQQSLPVTDFQAAVDKDNDLKATVQWMQSSRHVDKLSDAVILKDEEGVTILAATYTGAHGEAADVLRHCKDNACVSAVVDQPEPGSEVTWTTPKGPIPIRTILPPVLLRFLDPADPVRTARLAPPDETPPAMRTAAQRLEQATKPTLKNSKRAIRLRSVLGGTYSFGAFTFTPFVNDLKNAGWTNVKESYYTKDKAFEADLSSMGPDDALLWVAHGDAKGENGPMVGMSWAINSTKDGFYPLTTIKSQLESNPNDGPGILFLGGCGTAELLDQLKSDKRVVLGFERCLRHRPALFRTARARAIIDAMS